MQHPLTCPPRLPHPSHLPLGPFHVLERSERSSGRQREWQRDTALAGHVPAGRGGHRQAECRGKAAVRDDGAVPQKDMGLFRATGPPLLLCPQHTLTLHQLGTVISGPGDHQGTFSLEMGHCPDPPPRERAGRRQAKSSGTVHQPGLQSPPQPISRGRGHHRRPLWVTSAGRIERTFASWSLKPRGQSISNRQEQAATQPAQAPFSAHHSPLPTNIPFNSFHAALNTTPTLQT